MSNLTYVRLPLQGAFNVRELGGYPAESGKPTKGHAFLRADGLHHLTPSDIDYLVEYGLTSVVDLRSEDEILRSPNPLADYPGVDYINISMIIGSIDDVTQAVVEHKERFLSMFYMQLIQKASTSICDVFNFFADHKEGVTLYHCSAGKDRTGIISALLLGLAGADKFDILSDYQISYTNLRRNPAFLEKFGDNLSELLFSRAKDMEPVLQYIYDNHGSIEKYLQSIGVSQDNLKIIKNKLV